MSCVQRATSRALVDGAKTVFALEIVMAAKNLLNQIGCTLQLVKAFAAGAKAVFALEIAMAAKNLQGCRKSHLINMQSHVASSHVLPCSTGGCKGGVST